MGWNTSVVIMNDALNEIEKDSDFGKNLARAIDECASKGPSFTKGVYVSSLCHVNAATVIETHHADQLVPLLIGGNMGKILGNRDNCYISYAADNEHALREIARSMGYDLVKRKKR
jgi:hypothetical protein